MQHKAMTSRVCEQRFLHEVDNPVCADVDMTFRDHVGVEILSPSLAPCTPFLPVAHKDLSYECWPQSQCFTD